MFPFVGQVFHSVESLIKQLAFYGWMERKGQRRRLGGVLFLSFFDSNRQNTAILFLRKNIGHGILVLKSQVFSLSAEGQRVTRDQMEIVFDFSSDRNIRYWDLAATVADGVNDPDYTVGCLMSKTGDVLCIRDIRRLRGSPPEVESVVRDTALSDGKEIVIYMEQEPGSGGVNTIDFYRRKILSEYIFNADKSNIRKETRMVPFLSWCQAGKVKLLKGDWVNDFLRELEEFPYGFHDDQIDAASGAFNKLV